MRFSTSAAYNIFFHRLFRTAHVSTIPWAEIRYGFPEDPKADFVDTLLLKKIDQPDYDTGFWRIDNIAYATGSDLKAELLVAFAE